MKKFLASLTRHEKENSAKNQRNDPADDAQPENADASTHRVNKQNTDRYHQLEVGAERASNLFLCNFTDVQRSSDAESSTSDTNEDASDDKHCKILRPDGETPADGERNH